MRIKPFTFKKTKRIVKKYRGLSVDLSAQDAIVLMAALRGEVKLDPSVQAIDLTSSHPEYGRRASDIPNDPYLKLGKLYDELEAFTEGVHESP